MLLRLFTNPLSIQETFEENESQVRKWEVRQFRGHQRWKLLAFNSSVICTRLCGVVAPVRGLSAPARGCRLTAGGSESAQLFRELEKATCRFCMCDEERRERREKKLPEVHTEKSNGREAEGSYATRDGTRFCVCAPWTVLLT